MTRTSIRKPASKQAEAERIRRQTEEFLARGRAVEVVDSSVFADPTRIACKTMRRRIGEDVAEQARAKE